MTLPKDPNMLYSVINMKLRDVYPSLDDLCRAMDINKDDILIPLGDAGFHYDAVNNCFV